MFLLSLLFSVSPINFVLIALLILRLTHQEDKLIQVVYSNYNLTEMLNSADSASCPSTTNHRFTDIYLFAKNPLSTPVQIFNIDCNIVWDGGIDPEGSVFPAVSIANAQGAPNLVVLPHDVAVYKQRLCLVDDMAALGSLLMYISEVSDLQGILPFNLLYSTSGTFNISIGALASPFRNLSLSYSQSGFNAVSLATS
jgi:hypothetical protein